MIGSSGSALSACAGWARKGGQSLPGPVGVHGSKNPSLSDWGEGFINWGYIEVEKNSMLVNKERPPLHEAVFPISAHAKVMSNGIRRPVQYALRHHPG